MRILISKCKLIFIAQFLSPQKAINITVWSLPKFATDFDHIESQITLKVGAGATLHHCPQTLGRDCR